MRTIIALFLINFGVLVMVFNDKPTLLLFVVAILFTSAFVCMFIAGVLLGAAYLKHKSD